MSDCIVCGMPYGVLSVLFIRSYSFINRRMGLILGFRVLILLKPKCIKMELIKHMLFNQIHSIRARERAFQLILFYP